MTAEHVAAHRFDAIFLDAGGVLVAPDPVKVLALFEGIGLAVDPEGLFEAHYRGVQALDAAGAGPQEFVDYHRAYVQTLAGSIDTELEIAAAALADLWGQSELWSSPLPWTREALAALADTGLPIVIVSNADGTVEHLLSSTGVCQVGPGDGVEVAAVIDSGAVGVAKPDPRIFAIAADAVGVDPARAIHVGDTYQYDVRGARAAGVHPVLVDPLGIRADADCDRVASLLDVIPLLDA